MKQPGEELAEPDEDQGNDGGGGQHLADDQGLGCTVEGDGDLHKGHEGDLRTDPDQQQQEGIDHQVDVD